MKNQLENAVNRAINEDLFLASLKGMSSHEIVRAVGLRVANANRVFMVNGWPQWPSKSEKMINELIELFRVIIHVNRNALEKATEEIENV